MNSGLIWKGKTLISAINPDKQAERAVLGAKILPGTLYFVPSPLRGYGLQTLLERLAPHSAVLCVEAEPELAEITQNETPPELFTDARIAFFHTKTAALLCEAVRRKWGARVFRRVESVRTSGGWQAAKETYAAMEAALRENISSEWSNALTLTRLGRLYARNLLRNLRSFPTLPSVTEIDFGNSPVLVLGAGTTVDTFFAQNPCPRLPIICVDTALPALLERGITPALVVALEAQRWNLADFTGCAPPKERPYSLAMDLSSLPAAANIFGVKTYFYATRWTRLSLFSRLEKAGLLPLEIPPLGSVGLSAVSLALRLTSGPVITAGLDFAFLPGAFHCRASSSHKAHLRRANRFTGCPPLPPGAKPARAKHGQPCYTTPPLLRYRDLFEREFSSNPRVFALDLDGPALELGVRTWGREGLGERNEGRGMRKESFSSKIYRTTDIYPGRPQDSRTDTLTPHPSPLTPPEAPPPLPFLQREISSMLRLRAILTGEEPAGEGELDALIDTLDYLWAHFPDCAAGEGKRPPVSDLVFLKRVRVEIEPFLKSLGLS